MANFIRKVIVTGLGLSLAAASAYADDAQRDQAGTETGAQQSGAQQSGEVAQSGEQEARQAGAQEGQQQWKQQIRSTSALNHLHHINQKEIELARLGEEKAQSNEVKQASKRIRQDHEQADKRLRDAAKQANVELTEYQPATHDRAVRERLEQFEGRQFDQAYLEVMQMGHQMAMQNLDNIQELAAGNEQLRQAVDVVRPTIQQHMQTNQNLAQQFEEQPAAEGEAEPAPAE